MDLETENRIAAILMKEAAELRRQAARDGIDAYLHTPNVRGRPNSRFLTATVLGVQQSNRAVEVKEMWRAREKEKEMDNRLKKNEKRVARNGVGASQQDTSTRFEDCERNSSLCSSSSTAIEDEPRDNEIEEFLRSRAKRGRGTIGSRMDETGPYLPDSKGMGYKESWGNHGPEKPFNLKSNISSDEDPCMERAKRVSSSKHHSTKHRSKDKFRDKKRQREKKRSKHDKVKTS